MDPLTEDMAQKKVLTVNPLMSPGIVYEYASHDTDLMKTATKYSTLVTLVTTPSVPNVLLLGKLPEDAKRSAVASQTTIYLPRKYELENRRCASWRGSIYT